MELTREEIENYATIDGERVYTGAVLKYIAKQLLAERDKPKVWDNAPIDACHMRGYFTNIDEKQVSEFAYHRTPPKSRIDEIAESAMKLYIPNDDSKLTAIIKGAILTYAEESK